MLCTVHVLLYFGNEIRVLFVKCIDIFKSDLDIFTHCYQWLLHKPSKFHNFRWLSLLLNIQEKTKNVIIKEGIIMVPIKKTYHKTYI